MKNKSRIYLCVVPPIWWGDSTPQPEFAQLVQEVMAIERRLPKQIDTERERTRHATCSHRIEQIVREHYKELSDIDQYEELLRDGSIVAVHLDGEYLDILAKMLAEIGKRNITSIQRLGSTIFPPQDVEDLFNLTNHLAEFEKLVNLCEIGEHPQILSRLSILKSAIQQRSGLVEIQDVYFELRGDKPDDEQAETPPITIIQALATMGSSDIERDDTILAPLDDMQRRSQHTAMRAEVQRALINDHIVNFNNYSHPTITNVLHEYVYAQSDNRQPRLLKVVYGDGSQARPFPVYSLPVPDSSRITDFQGMSPLRVAILSIRHLEMDREVDMAWFRNSEASLRRTCYADTDEFCYRETLRQLGEVKATDTLLIHLYQTGLEPAIVGFYRGLVEFLKTSRRVAVVPKFFRGEGVYSSGPMWL